MTSPSRISVRASQSCAPATTGTREVAPAALASTTAALADEPAEMAGSDVFVIAVPTPVDERREPDLGALIGASRTVGAQLAKGALVVVESTVYPGVTEDICGPEIEAASGLTAGEDFLLGYAPERINPGDHEHSVERITKVVAGQTPEATATLEAMYGAITAGGVFVARNIRTAEAAKVIENAQRDINIAFVNEVTRIFHKLDISSHDVLDAARTKWNFLDFRPGLGRRPLHRRRPVLPGAPSAPSGPRPRDHSRRSTHQRRHGPLCRRRDRRPRR